MRKETIREVNSYKLIKDLLPIICDTMYVGCRYGAPAAPQGKTLSNALRIANGMLTGIVRFAHQNDVEMYVWKFYTCEEYQEDDLVLPSQQYTTGERICLGLDAYADVDKLVTYILSVGGFEVLLVHSNAGGPHEYYVEVSIPEKVKVDAVVRYVDHEADGMYVYDDDYASVKNNSKQCKDETHTTL